MLFILRHALLALYVPATWNILQFNNCSSKLLLKNGNIVKKDNMVGSIATYYCNKEFLIIGNPRRQCLLDGEWSGFLPMCISKSEIEVSISSKINL